MSHSYWQRGFGAVPLHLPGGEVYSALQRGVADAAESSVSTISQSGYARRTVTVSNHSYFGYAVVAGRDSLQSLSEVQQTLVLQAIRNAELVQREEVRQATLDSIRTIRPEDESGVYFLSTAERDVLVAASAPAYEGIEKIAGRATVTSFVNFGLRFSGTEEARSDPIQYPVWYATNRAPIASKDGVVIGYSGGRGGQVRYGLCWVTIPKSHRFGSLGSGWIRRFIFGDDRLKVYAVREMTEARFFQDVTAQLSLRSVDDQSVLIYIHGFRNSFDDALIRAAQIGADLQFPGVVMVFSWPSKEKMESYPADEATIEASEGHLTRFLVDVVRKNPSRKVHVIAHSMGNRAFLRAVNSAIFDATRKSGFKFGQVILAAPDVDIDVFRRLAAVFPGTSDRTTVYISSRDKAVAASQLLHSAPRAGYTPPVTVVSGMDTIDASSINVDLLGHGYIAEAEALLNDMFTLIQHGSPPPEKRVRLRSRETIDGVRYWAFAL